VEGVCICVAILEIGGIFEYDNLYENSFFLNCFKHIDSANFCKANIEDLHTGVEFPGGFQVIICINAWPTIYISSISEEIPLNLGCRMSESVAINTQNK